jgi:flagellar hook-length control protein FliK
MHKSGLIHAIFGFMSVDMRYENGSMILKILVDNQEVFKKLQDNSESIKFEFAKQGINLDNLEIKFKETESFANRNFQENHFAFDFNGR